MAKSKKAASEKKEIGTGIIIITVIIVFTFIPITIMGMLYFTNENFKYITNDYLSNMPGSIGEYFNKFPTRDERELKKKEVAKHFTAIEPYSAADKLIIIRNTDSKLFGELVKLMVQMDAKKTEKIMDRIREASIKKDILVSTIDQIRNDELTGIKEKAQYYERLDLLDAVTEINNSLNNQTVSFSSMGAIMEQMKEDKAAAILTRMDRQIANRILSTYVMKDKKLKTEDLMIQIANRKNQLINLAQIYNMENPEKLANDLGNVEKYKLEELSVIFSNMDIFNAAKVISKIEDKQLVYDIFHQMKQDEAMENGQTEVTLLMNATSVFEEFEDKVSEYVNTYSRMEPNKMVELISMLFRSTNPPYKYTLNEEKTITISDRDMAISILKKLQTKTLANVLSSMDSNLASEVSKELIRPSY